MSYKDIIGGITELSKPGLESSVIPPNKTINSDLSLL